MADLMDLYGGLGPGVGAMFQGQKRGEESLQAGLQRQATGAQTENLLQRLQMAQEMHPYDIAQRGAQTGQLQEQTRGLQQTNDVNAGVGSPNMVAGKTEEILGKTVEGGRKRFTEFLGDVVSGTNLDAAMSKYQLDPNDPRAQQIRQMTPQQRSILYNNMVKNQPGSLEKRQQEEAAFKRSKMQEDERTSRAIHVANIQAKARVDAAKERARHEEHAKNYQQAALHYYEAADAANKMDPPDTTAYRENMNKAWDMEKAGRADREASAPKPGSVDLKALNIPTIPNQPLNQLRGPGGPAAPRDAAEQPGAAPQGAQQIKDENEYNSLSSGSLYIDPRDGKTYKKP